MGSRCIRFMLLVTVLGAIALIALRIAGVGALKKQPPAPPSFVSHSGTCLLLHALIIDHVIKSCSEKQICNVRSDEIIH